MVEALQVSLLEGAPVEDSVPAQEEVLVSVQFIRCSDVTQELLLEGLQ